MTIRKRGGVGTGTGTLVRFGDAVAGRFEAEETAGALCCAVMVTVLPLSLKLARSGAVAATEISAAPLDSL